MAIVFISPKEKQKLFILIITGFFVIFIITISLLVFLANPKNIQTEKVFRAPKIRINFDVLKSSRVQNLEVFPGIEKQYSYEALDKNSQPQTGKITAMSTVFAEELLVVLGFKEIKLKEIISGRENPFVPYYEIKIPTETPTKKTIKK